MIAASGTDERGKGLVYVAALAPDAGETGAQLSAKFEPALVDGYIWLTETLFRTLRATYPRVSRI